MFQTSKAQKQKKTPSAIVQSYKAGPIHAIWQKKSVSEILYKNLLNSSLV